jgi:transposase InsO family protein
MVKIKKRGELKWCLEKHAVSKVTVKWAANHLKISPRRFKQLYAQYRDTNTVPLVGLNVGRPKKQITPETFEIVKQAYEKDRLNAAYLEKVIYARQRISIPHGTIHKVLIKLGYARHQPSKQKRRAPWIRYERKHSLSLVHTDWHYCENGKYLCTILDDALRKVIAAGEFDNETTENSLAVLKKACRECRQWYSIRAVLSDHGSQFYANKRDKKGYAQHRYEQFLLAKGIRHVLITVNHPQTNGKLEKFHDFYIKS